MASETTEKYFVVEKTTGTNLREPWETDPIVVPLRDRRVNMGGPIQLSCDYEANTKVHIKWECGEKVVQGRGHPKSGSTWMEIGKVALKHNGNNYKVTITDTKGKTAFTSAYIYVYG